MKETRFAQPTVAGASHRPAIKRGARDVEPHRGDSVGNPVVSVIVPTRNRADRLPQALDSIYALEGRGADFDTEIIVVDDASTDETRDVVYRYDGARYIRLPERRGVAAALNEGLRASRGCYITFLDDDDVFLPHKLRVQVSLLVRHPEIGVVYGQSLLRYGQKEWLIPDALEAPTGWIFSKLLTHNSCGHLASLLFRREAFDKAGLFDESLTSYEDYDMSLRVAFHFPFLFVPGAVDVYNLSPHGLWLSSALNGSGDRDRLRVLRKGLALLPKSRRHQELRRAAMAWAALDAASPVVVTGDLAQASAKLVAALEAHPRVLRQGWARRHVRWVAGAYVAAAASPLPSARDLCDRIKSATRKGGFIGRWWVRLTLAEIWADVVTTGRSDARLSDRNAARAAVRAIVCAPWYLGRATLVGAVVRGVLGRRAEAACKVCYGWLRRITRQTE